MPTNPYAGPTGGILGRGTAGRLGRNVAAQSPYGHQAQDLLGDYGAAGSFSPYGSPAIMARVRRNAQAGVDARLRRGQVASRLYGLRDPAQAASALLGIGDEAAGQAAGEINQAQLEQLLGAQNFGRGLYMNRLGAEDQMRLARLQQKMAREARGGVGAQLGGLVGTGLGAFLGGPGGAALGNRLFGGGSRSPYGSPEDQWAWYGGE